MTIQTNPFGRVLEGFQLERFGNPSFGKVPTPSPTPIHLHHTSTSPSPAPEPTPAPKAPQALSIGTDIFEARVTVTSLRRKAMR